MKLHLAVFAAFFLGSLLVALFGLGAAPSITQVEAAATTAEFQPALMPSGGELEGDSTEVTEECELPVSYPDAIVRWCDLIQKYAQAQNLEPGLVAALMLEESGGDPLAYSKDGAVGLLQVMPRDGLAAAFTCPGGPCFASRPLTAELRDPDFNLAYGTKLLAGLVSQSGDLRDALKAYGPTGVGHAYADAVLAIRDRYR